MWKGWAVRVSQKASMAASLAGCNRRTSLPEMSPAISCKGAAMANMPIAMRRAVADAASSEARSSRQAEAAPTTRAVVR
ncbi:hypothetical protein GALL_537540 [mine drainage metagenome]|uniref:Lipoprotein n=1 Tax=mine drainage metagenome TaxID=410659 RepID=A0A1J5PMB0_9ZZZZ